MVKQVVWGICVVIAAAGTADAQGPAQQGPVGMTQYLQNAYGNIKRNLTEAANKLSDADYAFKPTTMPEVRTFGQLFGHVANAQFGQCAAAKGVPNPNMGTNNEQKTTKAEIGKALADSFAFCDDAFSSLSEQNRGQIMARGRGQMAREAILADLIAHSNEMYGYAGRVLLDPPDEDLLCAHRKGLLGSGRAAV
ncbi:MAG: DinB family protein [Vicinamibacterales bacterium]